MRNHTILVALGLPKGATDKAVTDKLVELSDQALAGKQVVARVQAILGLPENEPIDIVCERVLAMAAELKSTRDELGVDEHLPQGQAVPFMVRGFVQLASEGADAKAGMKAVRETLGLADATEIDGVIATINVLMAAEERAEQDVASHKRHVDECEAHNAQLIEDAEQARELATTAARQVEVACTKLRAREAELYILRRDSVKLAALATAIGDVGNKLLNDELRK